MLRAVSLADGKGKAGLPAAWVSGVRNCSGTSASFCAMAIWPFGILLLSVALLMISPSRRLMSACVAVSICSGNANFEGHPPGEGGPNSSNAIFEVVINIAAKQPSAPTFRERVLSRVRMSHANALTSHLAVNLPARHYGKSAPTIIT